MREPELLPEPGSPRSQFSLRTLMLTVTAWAMVSALAGTIGWGAIWTLAWCGLFTACLLFLGDWLARRPLTTRTLSIIALATIATSFFLPVFSVFSVQYGIDVWLLFLQFPVRFWELKSPSDFREAAGAYTLLTCGTLSAYGTLLAIPLAIGANFPLKSRTRQVSSVVAGLTALSGTTFLVYVTESRNLSELLSLFGSGYYVWLLGLTFLWLAHAPRRGIGLIIQGSAALVILILACFAMPLVQ